LPPAIQTSWSPSPPSSEPQESTHLRYTRFFDTDTRIAWDCILGIERLRDIRIDFPIEYRRPPRTHCSQRSTSCLLTSSATILHWHSHLHVATSAATYKLAFRNGHQALGFSREAVAALGKPAAVCYAFQFSCSRQQIRQGRPFTDGGRHTHRLQSAHDAPIHLEQAIRLEGRPGRRATNIWSGEFTLG